MITKIQIVFVCLLGLVLSATAQPNCSKRWGANPADSVKAIENHSLYRDFVKAKTYEQAIPYWEVAYQLAPGASERHSIDGIEIFKYMAQKEQDAAKKKEYIDRVFSLYDFWKACYGKADDITLRKALDMYALQADVTETYKTFQEAEKLYAGKAPYYMVVPYVYVAVYLYNTNASISKEDMRNMYTRINELCDKQIAAGKDVESYKTAKEQANGYFVSCSPAFFDCEYYVKKYTATYKYEATQANSDLRQTIKADLFKGKCPETEAFYVQLLADDDRWMVDNFDQQPCYYRYRFHMQKGQQDKAIALLDCVLADATVTNDDKGELLYKLGYYYYTEVKSYSKARSYCQQALQYKKWGDPYILIGDMYAASASSCGEGDPMMGRMAISAAIDKWIQAKSVDPGVAEKASSRIGRYTASLPNNEAIFLDPSLKLGASYRVGCWIQETTTVRSSGN
jgi:hypothetical protein